MMNYSIPPFTHLPPPLFPEDGKKETPQNSLLYDPQELEEWYLLHRRSRATSHHHPGYSKMGWVRYYRRNRKELYPQKHSSPRKKKTSFPVNTIRLLKLDESRTTATCYSSWLNHPIPGMTLFEFRQVITSEIIKSILLYTQQPFHAYIHGICGEDLFHLFALQPMYARCPLITLPGKPQTLNCGMIRKDPCTSLMLYNIPRTSSTFSYNTTNTSTRRTFSPSFSLTCWDICIIPTAHPQLLFP